MHEPRARAGRLEPQLSPCDHRVEVIAKNWKHEPAVGMHAPGDVEPLRVLRAFTVGEHVLPVRILGDRPHVIRHVLDHQPHAARPERGGERSQIGFGAKLGIDPSRIDDVVSVPATLARGEDWRRVQM